MDQTHVVSLLVISYRVRESMGIYQMNLKNTVNVSYPNFNYPHTSNNLNLIVARADTKELLDHTPFLVFINAFSIVFSYLNISVIRTPLGPNVFR